jgi:hypothetical protein
MTTLEAVLYTGFFAVAALWLLLTPDAPVDRDQSEAAGQRQDLSPGSTGQHTETVGFDRRRWGERVIAADR